ncbi:hypothetical protein H8356DRAFT_1396085 [Neocallimastix lanati (nom. inval.)]|nr:hypothetical protein H8356DRAFT_1396085 [Neocallimastix sp. JGI-2020a]
MECRNENLVKYLTELDTDINKKKDNNINYIIELGADINKEASENGETSLFDTCESGNENLVKIFE